MGEFLGDPSLLVAILVFALLVAFMALFVYCALGQLPAVDNVAILP